MKTKSQSFQLKIGMGVSVCVCGSCVLLLFFLRLFWIKFFNVNGISTTKLHSARWFLFSVFRCCCFCVCGKSFVKSGNKSPVYNAAVETTLHKFHKILTIPKKKKRIKAWFASRSLWILFGHLVENDITINKYNQNPHIAMHVLSILCVFRS